MEFEVKKQKIFDVLKKHRLGVISTVTAEGKPESALIGFNFFENFELTFGTFQTFRKYKNIKHNPHIAFVIGWDDDMTVQYEGTAYELTVEELEKYQGKYLEKYPGAKKFISNSEERFFKVVPDWIRFTNLSEQPEEVFEIKF